MGFGILFLGYIFTVFDTGILFIDSISVVFMQGLRLFGWILVTAGSFKLSRYIGKFHYARMASASLFSLSLIDSVCHIMTVYFDTPVSVLVRTVIFMMYAMAYFMFHFYALGGLCDITAEVGLEKENKRAKKLFLLSMAFCAVNFVAYIGLSDALTSIRYILFLIITVLISAFIYTCYMWICLPDENEEDTDAPKKEKKKNGKGKK